MSELAIVRAAVYLLRASGSKVSVRNVKDVIKTASRSGRGMGTDLVIALLKQVRDAESSDGLRNDLTRDAERFEGRNAPEQSRNTKEIFRNVLTRDAERSENLPEQSRNAVDKNKRDTEVESASAASTSLDAESSEVRTAPSQPDQLGLLGNVDSKPKRKRPAPIASRTGEILALMWRVVEPAVGRSQTQSAWCSRNARVAKDLARVGRSDDDLLAAHASATARFGETVYALSTVQKELVRLDAAATRDDVENVQSLADLPFNDYEVPEHEIWRGDPG